MAEEKDPFAGMSEVKTNAIKWGKVGDWFKGTLTDNTREVENKLSAKKEMQKVFEFKMHGGSFHNINEDRTVAAEATIIAKDAFMSVFAKGAVAAQMRNAKLGQIVGMRFVEEKKSSTAGFNATKVIKVFLGEQDPDYKGETAADGGMPPLGDVKF